MDQAAELRVPPERMKSAPNPGQQIRVVSVTSGKGGVGKTNIVVNLAYALAMRGKRVMVLDADVGLANVDILLGLNPQYTIQHLLNGEKGLTDILVKGPGGILILPASSGIQELAELTREQRIHLLSAFETMDRKIDILVIDTGAGISSNVMYFNVAAHEIIVVVSPEPTSITDAYALMKVMSLRYAEHHFNLLVNGAKDNIDADKVFEKLSMVAERFLNISISYLGYIPYDNHVKKAVKQQKIVMERYPEATVSRSFHVLAEKFLKTSVPITSNRGNIKFFWRQLFKRDDLEKR